VFAAIEVDLAGVAHGAEVELKLFVDLNHQGVHAIQPSAKEKNKEDLGLGLTVRFPRKLSVQNFFNGEVVNSRFQNNKVPKYLYWNHNKPNFLLRFHSIFTVNT
jgi:hypothetical protein